MQPAGERPADGFHLWIHPSLRDQTDVLPLIIAYTSWVYHVMRGKVTESEVKTRDNAY